MQIANGSRVKIKVDGSLVEGVVDGWNAKYSLHYVITDDGRRLMRKIHSVDSQQEVVVGSTRRLPAVPDQTPFSPTRRFDINTRFTFIKDLVKMVGGNGHATSLIVSGSGGLGKSFTVRMALCECGLVETDGFVFVKGNATPKALYRALYDNQNRVIVFDDCDSIMDNAVAVNVLKAALDSERSRTITWLAESRGEDSLPNQFIFSGKVIIVTNKCSNDIPQALVSRAHCVDVTMTTDEKIDRMRGLVQDIHPEIDMSIKVEAVDFLSEHRHRCKDLNMRTLLKVLQIRAAHQEWRELAEYSISF